MRLTQYIAESSLNVLLEGKMEDDLTAQIINRIKKRTPGFKVFDEKGVRYLVKKILEIDPTPRKSWRFNIKDWVLNKEVMFPEDVPMLKQELQLAKKFNITQYKMFDTRTKLSEYLDKIKEHRGIVDGIFNYTFDIDYSDKRFNIYHIQAKDRAEYVEKLGQCTSWCIATDQMFGHYGLPYYLLIDKKKTKHYAIVPSGGQFRDSAQNVENSQKMFEEFDKILNLREKYYYKEPPNINALIDRYIYAHEKLNDANDDMKRFVSDFFPVEFVKHVKNISEELQLQLVRNNGLAILYLDNPSKEVQLAAVKENSAAIKHIKNPDDEMQIYVVTLYFDAIKMIDNPSENAKMAAVKAFPRGALNHIINPSEELQLAAVKIDGRAIVDIKQPTEKVQLAAVKQSGTMLGHIVNMVKPSHKVIMAAINQTGWAIDWVENPTEEMQLAAVRQEPASIVRIDAPTEKVQIEAVSKQPGLIKRMINPSEAAKKAAGV